MNVAKTAVLLGFFIATTLTAPVVAQPGSGWQTPDDTLRTLAARPLAAGEASPLPVADVEMPRAGDENAYGIKVPQDLQTAYDAFLAGDTAAALAALERVGAGDDRRLAWHLSALRAQVLIAAGRAADAERELDRTELLEQAAFGNTVFARALRGEALVWIGDFDRAVDVLTPVVEELRDWRLPTSYMAPPSNIPELVYKTTAQLRAYIALAAQYVLRGQPADALAWAERAEILFADVHYVSNHSLYGLFVSVHADSYYGRAINLSFLGAARAITARNMDAGADDLARADAFYDAIGFSGGKLTTQALRAWSALAIGDFERAEAEAARAVEMALAAGHADMIWRVQALRGEALLADGRPDEAERALRSAEAAVDAVSGALASDRAKRRFGVGKSDITYRLAQFDIARGDLAQLFADLERGRARAFVDMMAGVRIGAAQGDADAARIAAIDAEVRRLRLVSATRGESEPAGVAALLEERAARLAALAERKPELADALGVRVASIDDVRSGLRAGDVLVYGIPARGAEAMQLLMITADGAKLFATAATPDRLDAYLSALHDAVEAGDAGRQLRTGTALSEALSMGAWPAAKRYLVVPTGPLFFVPWGMVTGDAPVVVLPNAGWVQRADAGPDADTGVVVVGDPDFGGALPQLPGARAEASSIAKLYGASSLSGAAATEPAVRGAVGTRASVLHLATHGRFEPAFPLRSAVYLAGTSGAAEAVTARDLFAEPLPARFVVLSACETGVGQTTAGDDFLGLVRSFYLGGSVGVVNSLWPVDDAGTKVFMEAFHGNLPRGASAAWLAARDAARDAGFPPSVYGAFVLGGALDG
ncbi:MAG: CHAT domain-containing protein [Alphaproteobacteria bacterium]|nr:CHAT domain-containing protein [Alphaproteobacteria bacterium]